MENNPDDRDPPRCIRLAAQQKQGAERGLPISGPDAINYMHIRKNEIKSLTFTIDKNKLQVHQRAIRDV